MKNRNAFSKERRRSQRGAVALEYILIASLVAIALIGSFVYFRGTLKNSVATISDTTANAVNSSLEAATTERSDGGSNINAAPTINP